MEQEEGQKNYFPPEHFVQHCSSWKQEHGMTADFCTPLARATVCLAKMPQMAQQIMMRLHNGQVPLIIGRIFKRESHEMPNPPLPPNSKKFEFFSVHTTTFRLHVYSM
jgi:hypothetical protein